MWKHMFGESTSLFDEFNWLSREMDRLFEPFYTTKSSGLGMGLAICRSIIQTHGGRLWATANEPRGAVFQFTLPLQRDESIPAQQVRPSSVA